MSTTTTIIFGIVLIVAAVFLVVAVLMQQGKAHNLSGAIAGGAETFFGKSKAQTMNKKLSILTSVVAIAFVIIVVVFYVMQSESNYASLSDYFKGIEKTEEETTATADTTAADTTAEDVATEAAESVAEDTTVAE